MEEGGGQILLELAFKMTKNVNQNRVYSVYICYVLIRIDVMNNKTTILSNYTAEGSHGGLQATKCS